MEPGPVRRMMTARGPRATGHLFLLGLLALLAGCLPRRTTVEAADDSFGDLNGAGAPADRCVAGLGAQAPLSFQARTAFFQGFRGRVLGSLLEAPRRARGTVLDGGLAPLRAGARPFAPDALESIRGDVQPGHHSHIPPLVPAHATTLDLRGVTGNADLSADLLIALRTAGEDERIAREIGESAARVRRGVGSLVIGVILPMGGSPGQRRSAGLIREGIEVRLGARDAGEVGIEVEVVDDSREGLTSAGILRQLEERGTVAIIGPLSRAGVEALVAVRKVPIPTISPTARIPPGLATGVYSAGGLDPTAAALLASYATGVGLRTVVVIHSSLPESSFEAREFVEGFRRRGGKVLAQLAYDPGTTDFQELLGTVATLKPDGLVLPLPPQDIQPLARQVTFLRSGYARDPAPGHGRMDERPSLPATRSPAHGGRDRGHPHGSVHPVGPLRGLRPGV